MEDIVALPKRKQRFLPWATAAGFISSTFFGIWLVESFVESGDEGLTTGMVVGITSAMVAVWILIPLTCWLIANREWRGLQWDSSMRQFVLRRARGGTELRVDASTVSDAYAGDLEFDEQQALDSAQSSSGLPGRAEGITNRPVHFNLLLVADGRTHTIDCHSRSAAEVAAKRVLELVAS